MLWDVSWDQNNVINGRRYSEYVADILGSAPVIPPKRRPGGNTRAPPTAGPSAQVPTTSPAGESPRMCPSTRSYKLLGKLKRSNEIKDFEEASDKLKTA